MFVGDAVWFCRFVEMSRGGGCTRQPQRRDLCQGVSDQHWACHWALQGQKRRFCRVQQVCSGLELGAAAGLGRWFVGGAGMLVCGDFQRRRQHSATTAHRALPVCEWSALGMPWGTAGSNAASAVCDRSGGDCTGGYERAGQVGCGGCGFACLWRFPEETAVLSSHSAQSPGV